MCGIAGFYHSSIPTAEHQATIQKMLHLIEHRGPDENGSHIEKGATLGNARLSIIDIKNGQQPMRDETARYWICYSGEIYNFKALRQELINAGYSFKTDTDTEVALYAWIAWEEKALKRFNGSFAFAIYDKMEDKLVLARDRYGKRPLFYYYDGKELAFASEIKCFLAYPPIQFSFDVNSIATIFASWTPLPNESPFKSIHQVPMGTYLTIKENRQTISEYSDLNFADFSAEEISEDRAVELLQEKLTESVRARLVGDVEIGTYLSGGIDSAIVTKLAIEQGNSSIRSFSVSFEDKEFDEYEKQKSLSKFLGTKHEVVQVTNSDIASAFPETIWHAEMPLFRTANVPMYLLSKRVKESGIKVVLTGEGADESFLGYDIFKETLLRHKLKSGIFGDQEKVIASKLHPYLDFYKNENHKYIWGMYNQFAGNVNSEIFSHEMRFNQSAIALRLLNVEAGLNDLNHFIAQTPSFDKFNILQKAQWIEFKTLLAGYLLSSQGDRMSFANGVENRCPFLDSNIVEYAMSLPNNYKLKNEINEKYILKKAFADKLPEFVTNQPKQPYRSPDALVFLGKNKPDYLDAALSEIEIKKLDFINIEYYKKFINKIYKTAPEKISPRESQAFTQLLSLSFLNQFFVLRHNFAN